MSAHDWKKWAQEAAPILFGEINKHRSTPNREWRWGENGSMSLDLLNGRFYDHEATEGGGLLWAVMHKQGLSSHGDAWHWLEQQGIAPAPVGGSSPQPIIFRIPSAEPDEDTGPDETALKSAAAARQWAEAGPIEGTPAEAYLRSRGITQWPADTARARFA